MSIMYTKTIQEQHKPLRWLMFLANIYFSTVFDVLKTFKQIYKENRFNLKHTYSKTKIRNIPWKADKIQKYSIRERKNCFNSAILVACFFFVDGVKKMNVFEFVGVIELNLL